LFGGIIQADRDKSLPGPALIEQLRMILAGIVGELDRVLDAIVLINHEGNEKWWM
jgi:hypothetical protein